MATFIEIAVSVCSAAAATASVFTALYLGRRSEAFAETQQRQAAFSAIAEWRRDFRLWASEAISVLSEAIYLCPNFTDLQDERALACRYRLSALIDQGRLFLPNIHRDKYGREKPDAYQGFRHMALDPLVVAEQVIGSGHIGLYKNQREALVEMKRTFVSSVQKILDPEKHNKEITRMFIAGHEMNKDEPAFNGLLAADDAPGENRTH